MFSIFDNIGYSSHMRKSSIAVALVQLLLQVFELQQSGLEVPWQQWQLGSASHGSTPSTANAFEQLFVQLLVEQQAASWPDLQQWHIASVSQVSLTIVTGYSISSFVSHADGSKEQGSGSPISSSDRHEGSLSQGSETSI